MYKLHTYIYCMCISVCMSPATIYLSSLQRYPYITPRDILHAKDGGGFTQRASKVPSWDEELELRQCKARHEGRVRLGLGRTLREVTLGIK